jgi:tetratricopeptide (TPR) repeat protein
VRPAHVERRRTAIAALLLAALVVAIYFPATGFGFSGLDDPRFVTGNAHIRAGLSWETLRWSLANTELGFYCPATCLSHAADWTMFGSWAGGHHATSVLLHAAAGVLLLLAFVRMTGELAPSLAVAALFALHPLRVEPVAWLAERKEVLCGFFWCATLLAYALYAAKPAAVRYAAVLALASLAMAAKPMAVTIPFALLLLDVWPLGRWTPHYGRLVAEKLPLLLPAAGISLLTLHAQSAIGAVGSVGSFPLFERLANAVAAYGAYAVKTIVPAHLCALYPFRHGTMPAGPLATGIGVLAAGTAVAFLARCKRPCLTVGWLWFVGTLVPAIGLVHVGSQEMADRYTYVPHIGLIAGMVFAVWPDLEAASERARAIAGGIVIVLVAALAFVSRAQLSTWRDDESLYRQILRVSPDAVLAWFNLGNLTLTVKNDPQGAADLYEKALAIDPRFGDVHLRLGMALARLGKRDDALKHFEEAVRLKPNLGEAHLSLGTALAMAGRPQEAIGHLTEAERLVPAYGGPAEFEIGNVLTNMGRPDAAIPHFARSLLFDREAASVHNNLGYALFLTGSYVQAIEHYREALRIRPDFPEASRNLDNAREAQARAGETPLHAQAVAIHKRCVDLSEASRIDEAIDCFREVLDLDSGSPDAHNDLGVALARANRIAEARDQFREALRLEPSSESARANLKRAEALLGGR